MCNYIEDGSDQLDVTDRALALSTLAFVYSKGGSSSYLGEEVTAAKLGLSIAEINFIAFAMTAVIFVCRGWYHFSSS